MKLLARATLLALLLTPLASGCAGNADDDHYDRAIAIERELLRTNPEIEYGHPGYVSVLRELAQVPRGAADRQRADALAQRISDGRRIAARDAMEQIDHLPGRLEGVEMPHPPRPAESRRSSPAARRSARRVADDSLGELTATQIEKLDITMYSTSWCGYCSSARRYFTQRGWPFVEKDVEKDPAGAAEFRDVAGGRGGVPVIVINGEMLRGFSKPHVDQAVARAVRGS